MQPATCTFARGSGYDGFHPFVRLDVMRWLFLILWVLSTGMQWQCLPVPKDTHSKPAIHDTTVDKVFATWTDDGSLAYAFIANVGHLSDQKYLDLSVLHSDGTNTVAKKGLLRFEHIQQRHYGMTLMAYTLINVRCFCSA